MARRPSARPTRCSPAATRYDARLAALLDEALALAAPRAGGIAWESWFALRRRAAAVGQRARAGHGDPGAQSRAAIRLADPALLRGRPRGAGHLPQRAARRASGSRRRPGAHYLIYSFAPQLRVINGFVQSLNGLHDFGSSPTTTQGRALFAAGRGAGCASSCRATTPAPGRCTRRRASPTSATTSCCATSSQPLRAADELGATGVAERTCRTAGALTPALYCDDRRSRSRGTCTTPPETRCCGASAAPAACERRAYASPTRCRRSRPSRRASRYRGAVRSRGRTAAPGPRAPRAACSRRAGPGPTRSRVRAIDLAGNAGHAPRAPSRSPRRSASSLAPMGRRGRSSTRARAASARRRSRRRRRGAAPRRACGRSSSRPTRRTRSPTRCSASSGGEPDRGRRPPLGPAGLSPGARWSATGARCATGSARCSSSAASTASAPRS